MFNKIQTLIRWQANRVGRSQIQLHSIEQLLVTGHVRCANGLISLTIDRRQVLFTASRRITRDVRCTVVTGRTHNQQRHFISVGYLQDTIGRRNTTAADDWPKLSFIADTKLTTEDQSVVRRGLNRRAGSCKACSKVHAPRLASFDMHHDHLIGLTYKNLAYVFDVVDGVLSPIDRGR